LCQDNFYPHNVPQAANTGQFARSTRRGASLAACNALGGQLAATEVRCKLQCGFVADAGGAIAEQQSQITRSTLCSSFFVSPGIEQGHMSVHLNSTICKPKLQSYRVTVAKPSGVGEIVHQSAQAQHMHYC
jgi:hypothetical protein